MDFQPKFPAHIFRAYDIRGKLDVMSAELIRAIAQALATQYLKTGQTRLAIGYDARQSSPAFAEIIYKECLKQGLDAKIIGCCASPVLYYTARQFDGNGIMVTASHNPKSDNGIKWIMQGEPPLPEAIQQVARDANEYFDSHAEMNWQTLPHQIVPEYCLAYQAALLNDIQLMPQPRPYKVVVDGLYGSAGRCAVLVLKKLGCEVYALRCEANGEFPEHAPDPSQAKHLDLLRNAVQQQHADIGIAFDGDGDRVVLIDEKGVIISADRLLSLFAHMCLADHPAHEVVFDVKCSTMVRNTVLAHHGIPKMIRT
ncbi:MAG: phosphomannomutase/phosphoglucomutase, partial [Proteobacteria bacterium]|nr:phosphomannomutase/phosphoglucomutase [Pseudomonadota bacterium]